MIDGQLPSVPLLRYDEVPDFLHPSSPFWFLGRIVLGQFKSISKPFCILMDSFQELEHEIIDYMAKLCVIKPVGPLFINPKAPNTSVRGDILKADDCIEWLNSKPLASVAYISFGNSDFKLHVLPYGFLEKVGNRGKLIQWSPQEEVTNAKFLVDVFGVGVRLSRGLAENRLILRDEVEKCLLEATVGPKAVEVKQHALKWKTAAGEAVAEGGSSDQNIQSFVDEIRKRCVAATSA
ncbi:gallate 1-beta-glucosyltransferase 84A24-like [Alnus glutinosa]|uniref:gallate 1-beta-glucosyltransferase 84A24-like n=1 Tax=Alnus glutinosa TaxID=3517 RepID=UPI002D77E24C|nr:gallate 1-beta-glucosyltransferase 84A24-like [Alnus glutinosa]